MYIQPEALDVDSIEKESMKERERILKKTNTDMTEVLNREIEYSDPAYIISKVKELNPEVKMEADVDRGILYSSQPVENLVLPEGFYFGQKNGITNKHHTQSGIYGSV